MASLIHDKVKLYSQPSVALVEQIITPLQTGQIRFRGSFWRAQLYDHQSDVVIYPTSSVKVVGRIGITQLVIPMS